jgi:hypothetical protein
MEPSRRADRAVFRLIMPSRNRKIQQAEARAVDEQQTRSPQDSVGNDPRQQPLPVRESHLPGSAQNTGESDVPDVNECANPSCSAKFLRLGEGHLSVFPVDDPNAWGLPKHSRQKAVWLCNECASTMYVRLDRRRHLIHVAHKPQGHSKRAA